MIYDSLKDSNLYRILLIFPPQRVVSYDSSNPHFKRFEHFLYEVYTFQKQPLEP